jgi:hypothetical protein
VEEYRELFGKSGFDLQEIVPTASLVNLLIRASLCSSWSDLSGCHDGSLAGVREPKCQLRRLDSRRGELPARSPEKHRGGYNGWRCSRT